MQLYSATGLSRPARRDATPGRETPVRLSGPGTNRAAFMITEMRVSYAACNYHDHEAWYM